MFIGKWRSWLKRLSKASRRPRATSRGDCPLWLEQLETRQLLSAFTVNTTDDTDVLDGTLGDGTGHDANGHVSLRSAIEEANYERVPATINFRIGSNMQTISTSGLPVITVAFTLDGSCQPGLTPADPKALI